MCHCWYVDGSQAANETTAFPGPVLFHPDRRTRPASEILGFICLGSTEFHQMRVVEVYPRMAR